MNLLIDTHCWLWSLEAPDKLSAQARQLLADPQNEVFLSAASVWEIVIKSMIGKLTLPSPPGVFIPDRVAALNNQLLSITAAHVFALEQLPAHHRDPFDRLLIAQAISESMQLVTADPNIRKYSVALVWAGT
jgi:PIN domain nuclease of toxin-antitoxin system